MRNLLIALLALPTPAALADDDSTDDAAEEAEAEEAEAEDGAPAPGLDALLHNLPSVETRKSEAQLAEEEKRAYEARQISFPEYVRIVQEAVIEHWAPKARLLEKRPPLRTELMLHIAADGTVDDVGAVQLSGNKKFDRAAIAAVNALPVLPAPPESLAAAAAQGVIISFSAASLR